MNKGLKRPAMLVALIVGVLVAPDGGSTARAWTPTDGHIDDAIRYGLRYLQWNVGQNTGVVKTKFATHHPGGVEALILLTHLEAGVKPDSRHLRMAMAYLHTVEPQTVYARSVRAMVLARRLEQEDRKLLAEDVSWLIRQQLKSPKTSAGGWGYGPEHPTTKLRPSWTDACNSHFALQALRDAAEVGVPVPAVVWRRAAEYWAAAQNDDGGWGYEPSSGSGPGLRGTSHGSMTAAGVATSLILAGKLAETAEPAGGSRKDNPPANLSSIQRGMAWLAGHYAVDKVPAWAWGSSEDWLNYYLSFLVGASGQAGLWEIGTHDVFRDVVEELYRRRRGNGSWPRAGAREDTLDIPVRTCFALLALIRARRPVLVSKLAPHGWAEAGNDCFDAANLVRWYGLQSGRKVNWRLVRPGSPKAAWAEAPILYIQGGPTRKLPQSIAATLRQFIRDGGTVLVQPFGGNEEFADHAKQFFLSVFPTFRAEPLAAGHPVFTARYKIDEKKHPQVVGLGDYCRTRIFILGSDLSGAWHRNDPKRSPEAFQWFANLLEYATDGVRSPGRMAYRTPPPERTKPIRWISIARVRHAADWDVGPQAFDRLGRALTAAVSIGVTEAPPVDLSAVPTVPLLWLTGSAAPKLSGPQRSNLKKYLAGGGTLFLDSACGRVEFVEAVTAMLAEMFGADSLKMLPEDSAILTGKVAGGMGSDIRKVAYTRHTPEAIRKAGRPVLQWIELNGRVAVIFSPYGVTCPMTGIPTFGCSGLSTDDACRLAANVVFHAFAPRKPQGERP